ncbi:unnamed protein product, partial [Discosporangium mesarthrocarpum]
PQLRDGPKTCNRPSLRGIRDRVVFVVHNQAEQGCAALRQRQDDIGSNSKINNHEVDMVECTVRYLLLQGYEADQ